MSIAAIMPCRGRAEQTVANVQRLLATAGRVEWQLICMVDDDYDMIKEAFGRANLPVWQMDVVRRGYWHALQQATSYWPEFDLLINLANDLLPGRDWLRRAVEEYCCCFGEDGDGLMGFNDGIHGPDHAPHFLISRRLLDHYGGWPVWYRHNFGDTELCSRAQLDGRYGKAPWAVLFHDHWINGGQKDAVYTEGGASHEHDRALFEYRRAHGWPLASGKLNG